jgi:hypothetical protein
MLTDKPPPRKWRIPVTLRIVAVLAPIGCGFAVWFAIVRQHHAEAIRAISTHGSSAVWRDYCPVWLNPLLDSDWQAWVMEVDRIQFTTPAETAERAVVHMKGLRKLPEIVFYDMAINNATLAHLRDVRGLKKLSLEWSQFSDSALAYVRKLTDLEELNLSHIDVRDAGLAHLNGLTNLRLLLLG